MNYESFTKRLDELNIGYTDSLEWFRKKRCHYVELVPGSLVDPKFNPCHIDNNLIGSPYCFAVFRFACETGELLAIEVSGE